MAETFVVGDNGKPTITKDPEAVLDYSYDWTTWLGTDNITTAVCASDDPLLTVQGTSNNGKIVTAWVSGGTPGSTANLRCRITTAAGRTDDRTVYLKIRDK